MRIRDPDGALLSELSVSNPHAAIAAKKQHFAGVVSPMAAYPVRACVEQPGWAMESRVTLKKLTIRSLQPSVHAMPGVWFASGAEIADHWQATYPAATHLHLKESIWQDHTGSLS